MPSNLEFVFNVTPDSELATDCHLISMGIWLHHKIVLGLHRLVSRRLSKYYFGEHLEEEENS